MTDTNYPPGVTNAHPVFHDPGRTGDEDAPCADCGHPEEDHLDGACAGEGRETTIGAEVLAMTCDCIEYIPYEETDPYGF
jgi:hypothetical protein